MNKQIRQLWEDNDSITVVWPETGSPVRVSAALLEKFAELIIDHATECVRDVLRDENSDLSYEAASQVQKRIKEYFGVEE